MAVPSKVVGIVVSNPRDGVSMNLLWNANPEVDVIGYNIYRSQAPELTSMVKLNTTPIAVTAYIDTTATQRINAVYYYTVTAVNSSAQESLKADAVTFVTLAIGRMGRILNEFIRRHYLAMNRIGGSGIAESVYYYVKKTAGPKCPICWVSEHGQAMDPFCTTCWGTGYEGGFVGLGWVKVIIDPPALILKLMDQGWIVDGRSSLFVSTYPRLKNGDLIVRKNNRRFELDDAKEYPWQNQVTAQLSKLVEIEPQNYQVFGLPTT